MKNLKKKFSIDFQNLRIKIVALVIMPFLIGVIIQSCNPREQGLPVKPHKSPEMVLKWNTQIQKAYTFQGAGSGFSPPLIARLFAMYHAGMHDVLNAIDPRFETYAYFEKDPEANPEAAVAQVVYDLFQEIGGTLKPIYSNSFDSLLQASLASVPDGQAKEKGIELGKKVAQAILTKRAPDGPYLQLAGYPTTPASGTESGQYQYIPPLNYALAGFHLQNTWVINSSDQFREEPPYPTNSPEYLADFNEVRDYGEKNSVLRSADQKAYGVFWAENTSRGWNGVARDIMSKVPEKIIDEWQAARLLALVHFAIADAYIAVFDSKVHFNYWRPISAIRQGDFDDNPNTIGNPIWESTLTTPPVGEYPSAHALTGAAAGQILIRYFKNKNIPITIDSGYWPGTRSFPDIKSAIRENSLSRIYIGYHFRKAVEVGEKSGFEVGDFVYDHALQPKFKNK
ncbi:vanadium-dependent haloperoxidase [Algoriphagus sp.]|uniref:vanadium-dependent haloperoxidase n=1 Tax=Algoriphagus sp. TaxID=1872435 RepID=UPI0025EDE474|nr:vanadium-dependent haloperoxidase [Algoriphagus sp.]